MKDASTHKSPFCLLLLLLSWYVSYQELGSLLIAICAFIGRPTTTHGVVVCMYAHGCVLLMWAVVGKVFCVFYIEWTSTCSWNLSTILVTVLCLFAAPAFEYSSLKCTHLVVFFHCPGLFCWTEIEYKWMYAILSEILSFGHLEESVLVKLWVIAWN